MSTLLSQAFKNTVPEEYSAELSRLDDIALEAILIRIIKSLPEEELVEFEAALALSDPRVLEAFLSHEVPDLEGIVRTTLRNFEAGATDVISVLES